MRSICKALAWSFLFPAITALSATVPVPNASFEGPATVFADPRVDSWQEVPKPDWFPQSAETWDQLIGVFLNTTNGSPDHIANIDGNQALFFTAVPGVGIFQDNNSFDWSSTNATHAFDAKFEPGKSYQLAVGVIAGGGNMVPGASVLMSLYYRDAASNVVTIGASNVVFSPAVFSTTNFVDQHVHVPTVRPSDPWAGKNIGIMIQSSIIDTNFVGGYWDFDNVRLQSFQNEIVVPNASFEGPATVFADPRVDSWQEVPKPDWFPQSAETWDQLIGVFLNTTNGSPDHIANIDGNQALFFTAVPGVGIFQDNNSFDWSSTNATHAFDAKFEPGKSYQLAVGVIAGGGNMVPGASVLMSLYYRDAASNVVTIGASNVVFSPAVFSTTNFVDQHVHVPTVRASDPWAGKNIGIMVQSSIIDTNFVGGYWDFDNVRLQSFQNEIVVPNASFEGPATVFADPRVDSWQEVPKPDWFPQSAETWDQLIGVFLNTTNGSPDHIANIDGNQALFFTAVPGVGIFQDNNSFDWSSTNASHAFDAKFEPGKSYRLAVGVIAGGGNMVPGASVLMSLYYRDAASNVVTIGASNVVFSPAVFSTTNFVDQHVHVPTVRPSDPWAGKNIGIMIQSSIIDTNFVGGYWDFDNVRLAVESGAEITLSIAATPGNVQVSWPSQIGFDYQLRSSTNLSTWTNHETPLPGTGNPLSRTVPRTGTHGFYSVVATPRP